MVIEAFENLVTDNESEVRLQIQNVVSNMETEIFKKLKNLLETGDKGAVLGSLMINLK